MKEASEQCGVWLDAVRLKANAKQKRDTPRTKGAGCLAVLLNVPQTRRPKTKQSSIDSFFPPIPRKMESTDSPAMGLGAAWGTKRRRDTDSEMSGCGQNLRAAPQPEPNGEGSLSPHRDTLCRAPGEQFGEINQSRSQEYAFGVDGEGKHLSSSQMDVEEKENILLSFDSSSQPCSRLRPLPRAASPLKPNQEHTRRGKPSMENIHSRYSSIQAIRSPMKKGGRQHGGNEEEDGLAMLFTQDSDGFRVIAHRGPPKDPSNVARKKPGPAYESLSEDAEELVFTQDSEGNTLIKH